MLGSTDAEHERLIRQAARFNPYTERLFRDAGIRPGQRILEIGSGVGDVAMLVAKLVGPTGEVVGIERDPRSLAKASTRATQAGLGNISFLQCDIAEVNRSDFFDGIVGRLILQFLPNPGAALRSLSQLLRPGGVMAFQEPTWAPLLQLTAHLPLWSSCASLVRTAFRKSGANPDMELVLFRSFAEAGLPSPKMLMELQMGDDPFFPKWLSDVFHSVRPQMDHHKISYAALGDCSTLEPRLMAELVELNSPGACVGLIAASCRLSTNHSAR